MFKNQVKLLEDGYKPEGDLLVKMDGPMCVGVYHIGKYPQVFISVSLKNGARWNIRYRAITLEIPNPISFIKFRFGDLFSEIQYAVKSFVSIRSGYVEMQRKYFDGDQYVWERAEPGDDDPYYICAKFNNGRHIPLPILDNWDDDNKLQKFAIKLAGGAAEAVEACQGFTE